MKDVITQMMDYPFNPDLWYPKKKNSYKKTPANRIVCPICSGLGQRRDKATGNLRTCLGCNGEGTIRTKGVSTLRLR